MGFKVVDQFRFGRAQDFIDFMDLVKLIYTVKQRILGDHFEQNTPVAPNIHLEVVVAIRHEALGSAIPPRRNILSVGGLAVYS